MDSIEQAPHEVAYDLREIYAVKILGESLIDVTRARKADNYSSYFKCLKDVWIVAQHRIKDKKLKVKGEDGKIKEMTTREYYNKLLEIAAGVINKYQNEFLGKGNDADGCGAIENILNEIEMFLYDKIEEAKLFGASKLIPGL